MGLVACVLSVMVSTGSISPMPMAFFHIRLAITVVKRGFSSEVSQLAYALREFISSNLKSSST